MLELSNEAQVRCALEGKSGFDQGIEDELIRRIAVAEAEQEQYEPLGTANKVCLILAGAIGMILAIAPFL